MYKNFQMNFESKGRIGNLEGYLWEVENPKYLMCIIHGIGEHAGRYDRMAGYLTEAGIAVVSMDLRGHGKSDGVQGHTAPRNEILDDIDLLIEKANEIYPGVPMVLYGHSMGGNICLDYHLRGNKNAVPVKYIISAPWLKLVKSFPGPVVALLKGVSKGFPTLTISSGCEAKDLGNLTITEDYDHDPLVHPNITLATASDCMTVADGLLKGSYPNNDGAKGKPWLLMHGSADKICDVTGSREYAKLHANDNSFTYIEWQGYYHEIHNGGPDATGEKVIETIRDFVLA